MMTLRARIISILLGFVILGFVSFLVRRRRLDNLYAMTWFLVSLALVAVGLVTGFIEFLASALGIYSTAVAILVVAFGGLMTIVLHLSVIVTEHHKQIRQFEKEIALLKKQSPESN